MLAAWPGGEEGACRPSSVITPSRRVKSLDDGDGDVDDARRQGNVLVQPPTWLIRLLLASLLYQFAAGVDRPHLYC